MDLRGNSESDWTCYSRSWITRACHGTTTTRERAIRQKVLHRKISSGRRTWTGAEVFEVILSTCETAKKKEERFIEMVREKFGTIEKSSEIAISLNFTAEHAENAEARLALKTLRPPR